MSWVEKVNKGITITTGDGKVYKPNWLNASFETSYQTASFEFIGVAGSLVKKEQPIGTKYSLELYFQGEDHLDTANAFKISCNDKRPWIIEHPLYEIINVQPTSLNFDDTSYSVTKVTGSVIETILEGPPNQSLQPEDQISVMTEIAIEEFSLGITVSPTPGDITQLGADNASAFNKGVKIITFDNQFEEYFNAYNTANTYIATATATPILMMRSVINVLTLPSQFTASVKSRLAVLVDTFDALRATLFGLIGVSSKQLFQNKAGATIAAMCQTAATPLPLDFRNSAPILETIDIIVAARAQYLADLDTLQTDNGGSPLSFVASAEPLIALNNLVNTTIAMLFNQSLSARSERSLICDKDTNWILLCHQVYGISDANLTDLIEQNDSTLNEYTQVQKGRKVVYYV